MELTGEHLIRSTSPEDLTMEQRYSLTLKFADLVMRAKGYERVIDPDESLQVQSDNGRRISSECG